MRRREFIALLGGSATWSLAARAEQPVPAIGFLTARSSEVSEPLLAAFRKSLEEEGFFEGQNVTIEIVGRRAITIGCPRWPLNS